MVKITVTGYPGAGKTTFCRLLAEKLGYKHHHVGGIIRKMAAEKGMTLEDFYKSLSNNPEAEKELDLYQKKLGEKEDSFVIEGRTSFHFIPDSIKLFLSVEPRVGAGRIYKQKLENNDRNESVQSSVEETAKIIKVRMEEEKRRYKELYNLDHHDVKHFDCCIDTTRLNPEEVIEEFLDKYPSLK